MQVQLFEGLKSEQIGYLGLDVYEQEADLFYEDLSERIIQDDALQRLVTFPKCDRDLSPSLLHRSSSREYFRHCRGESNSIRARRHPG